MLHGSPDSYVQYGTNCEPKSWSIGAIKTPGFGRKGLVHNVMSFANIPPVFAHGFDDEVS